MLWVYDQYKYFYSYSAGIYRRQILMTKVDPRTVRVKTNKNTTEKMVVVQFIK